MNYVPTMPTNDMYLSLNLLKFEDVYRLFILKFIHFILYEKPQMFLEYFYDFLPSHNYETRNTKINLPSARLDIEKQSTIFNCCKLINSVGEDLLDQNNL